MKSNSRTENEALKLTEALGKLTERLFGKISIGVLCISSLNSSAVCQLANNNDWTYSCRPCTLLPITRAPEILKRTEHVSGNNDESIPYVMTARKKLENPHERPRPCACAARLAMRSMVATSVCKTHWRALACLGERATSERTNDL